MKAQNHLNQRMPPARIGEWESELNVYAAVLFPCRGLPILGITVRAFISLIGRTEDHGGPSAALPQMRPAHWLKQARHADIFAVVYLPCAETFCGYFSHLRTSTSQLPLTTRKSRGCGAAQISKSSVLNRREFRPARLAIAVKRPAD